LKNENIAFESELMPLSEQRYLFAIAGRNRVSPSDQDSTLFVK